MSLLNVNIDYSIRHPLSANEDNNDNMIQMERGRPIDLLGSGHHFNDAPRHRRHNEHIICPMDNMFDRVKIQNLSRPKPTCRRKCSKRKRSI